MCEEYNTRKGNNSAAYSTVLSTRPPIRAFFKISSQKEYCNDIPTLGAPFRQPSYYHLPRNLQ
nr:MAG TPA: hypothetical protein [Caudoviricetes sp.]